MLCVPAPPPPISASVLVSGPTFRSENSCQAVPTLGTSGLWLPPVDPGCEPSARCGQRPPGRQPPTSPPLSRLLLRRPHPHPGGRNPGRVDSCHLAPERGLVVHPPYPFTCEVPRGCGTRRQLPPQAAEWDRNRTGLAQCWFCLLPRKGPQGNGNSGPRMKVQPVPVGKGAWAQGEEVPVGSTG